MTAESCPGREMPGPKANMEQRTRGNDEAESGYGTREPGEK